MFKYFIILILFINSIFALNLTIHDSDNPSASHILDAEIIDNILIVSGMVGGIEFYDISNREILNHLSNLQISEGAGGSVKPNCVIAKDDYLYMTTSQGLGIVNISNPSSPQYLGIVSGTNGYILENLDIHENFPNINYTLIIHNDPLHLKGSTSVNDRIRLLNICSQIYFVSRWV